MLSKQKREQVLALLVDSAKKRLTEQLKERNKSILNKEYMLKQQEKILQVSENFARKLLIDNLRFISYLLCSFMYSGF